MGKRSAPRVAVLIDGEVTVHMASDDGNYDTLCGLDENDPEIGFEPAEVPLNGRARIDCEHCRSLWKSAQKYTRSDFKDTP